MKIFAYAFCKTILLDILRHRMRCDACRKGYSSCASPKKAHDCH